MHHNFAVIIPMANEESEFDSLTNSLSKTLNILQCGRVYMIVDLVSKDNTLELCRRISNIDGRFITIWAPDNKNVVDAYMAGYRAALEAGHEYIIEMDAGLSHDPRAIPMFLRVLNEGNECAFGSRFMNGGSIYESTLKRSLLSKSGTILSNWLLGTNYYDATSGFQGFHARIVKDLIEFKLLSTAHFYQTEVRYLLRKTRFAEVPIHYRAPSPSVSKKAIKNSILTLLHYFWLRISKKAPIII